MLIAPLMAMIKSGNLKSGDRLPTMEIVFGRSLFMAAVTYGMLRRKSVPALGNAFDAHVATLCLHDRANDRQPEAHTAAAACGTRLCLSEALEQSRQEPGLDAHSRIADRDLRRTGVPLRDE